VTPRSVHPDADKFPACPFGPQGGRLPGGRVRRSVGDRYCDNQDVPATFVVLTNCLACKWGNHNGPVPPPRPKVGDVFAGWLAKWHRVTEPQECDCKKLSSEMNGNGPDWCEANADYLAGRVVENLNATKRLERFFPGKRAYFRWLIRRAARYCRDWKPTESG
jgi:hypothetical protein